MENAAKALVIAGAILISILLISVGIMVMNSTGDVQGQMESQMQSSAIQSFNSQFSSYVGGNRTAAQIRSLFDTVTASNAANADHQVFFDGYGDAANGITDMSGLGQKIAGLASNKKYTVSIIDSDTDGYYDEITINW